MEQATRSDSDSLGFALSLGLHGLLVLAMYLSDALNFNSFKDPVVYSVTMEGGKALGGMSQAPDPKTKTAEAPPKNVQDPVKKQQEEKIEEKKPEDQKVTAPKEVEKEVEDAEVSLQEKKKEEEKRKKIELDKKKAEDEKKKAEEKKKLEEQKKKDAEDKKKQAAVIDKNLQQAMQRYLGESNNAGGKGFGAARVGGNGMGGGVVRPPEFFTYLRILEQHIKSGWRWNDTSAALVAQVQIEIEPDGVVRDVFLKQSSGNSLFDDSIVRAVRKASPVPVPPQIVYEYFKSVLLTFDPRQ
jgi:colicin import membrane protein